VINNHRDEGMRLLQAGDIDGALAQLQHAIIEDPQDGRAQGLLGVCYAKKGNMPAALNAMEQAAALQPTDAGAQYNLALALFQVQRTGESQAVLDRALQLNPAHPGALDLRSRLSRSVDSPGIASAFEPPPPFSPGPLISGPGMVNPMVDPSGPTIVHPPQGMSFTPQVAQSANRAQPPGLSKRLLRGLGWGLVMGQWWTLWTIISIFLWGHASSTKFVIAALIIFGLMYGVMGVIAGLLIAALNAPIQKAIIIGVGVGLLACVLEIVWSGNPIQIINFVFYFFTGRFVGAGIAARVHQPVGP